MYVVSCQVGYGCLRARRPWFPDRSEVHDADEGGYYARALGHGIFTEAGTWEELRPNVLEAVSVHFEGGPVHPRLVQLHYVKDELLRVDAA